MGNIGFSASAISFAEDSESDSDMGADWRELGDPGVEELIAW